MRSATLAVTALLLVSRPASAYVGAPPLWRQLATSDCALLGRVEAYEESVRATLYPGGGPQQTFHVALVRITAPIWNTAGLTHVRVGFLAEAGTRTPRWVSVGHEVCLILERHHDEPFFVPNGWAESAAVKEEQDAVHYALHVLALQCWGAVLENPDRSLRSSNGEERLHAAALLLARYRSYPRHQGTKAASEPIPAEQSRLILESLAKADWTRPFPSDQIEPFGVFTMSFLNLQDKDNWPPKDFKHQKGMFSVPAVRSWLDTNAATYRIERYVPAQRATTK